MPCGLHEVHREIHTCTQHPLYGRETLTKHETPDRVMYDGVCHEEQCGVR